LLDVVTTLVLIAHLLCVNVAAGGPLLCAWLEWRRGPVARQAASCLGFASLLTLVGGGMLGVALGWLKWSPEYHSLWTSPLSYKLHWGIGEIVFSLFLAIGYWLWARGAAGDGVWPRVGRGALGLLNGTNLLYHFPPLFIVANKLHAAGQTSGETIRGAAFRHLAAAGETPALAVHVGLASLAVAAMMLLGLALRWMRRDEASADAKTVAVWGGRWALAASLAQLPVGLWMLLMLPSGAQAGLMGSDGLATSLFFAAMLAALWLLRELAAMSMGEVARPNLVRAMIAMLATVSLMTAMQQSIQ
jgi:hypothetical protein